VPSLVVTGGPYSNTKNGTFVNEVVATTICAHQEYMFTIYDALVDNPTEGDGMNFFEGNKNRQVVLLLFEYFFSSIALSCCRRFFSFPNISVSLFLFHKDVLVVCILQYIDNLALFPVVSSCLKCCRTCSGLRELGVVWG